MPDDQQQTPRTTPVAPDRDRGPDRGPERDARTGSPAAALRIQQQSRWVELQIQRAMERGDFDDLPGRGKPIEDLGETHDPDWWLKKLVEREQIVVLPPALQLRKDDAALDDRLDQLATEVEVRRELEDFNARVLRARYTPIDGPPLITMPREVETEVTAWRERRDVRRAAQAELARQRREAEPVSRWRRWTGRRRRG